MKEMHEKCGFELTNGFKGLLLQRVEYGSQLCLMVCTHLWTTLYPKVGTQLMLFWSGLHASSCRPSNYLVIEQKYWSIFPLLLAERGH
jgi:hypothetical protein